MTKAIFDIAGDLDLVFRIARTGSKTLNFIDPDQVAYPLAGNTFQLNVKLKPNSEDNIFQLTSGNGLTVGASSIAIAVDEARTDLKEKIYFWELYETVNKKTWLCGNAYFIKKKPVNDSDSTTVTVRLNPDVVTVIISNTVGGGSGSSNFRGLWETVDELPSEDLVAGDEWYLTIDSTLDAGDGDGDRIVQAGAILKFISEGLWRFIE
jgi:hypothetical protein